MALVGQQQKPNTTATRMKAQRGFKTMINGESKATYVNPGSIVDVPYNVACNLRAAQKAYAVDPATPLKLITDYKVQERSRGHHAEDMAAVKAELAAVKAQLADISRRYQQKGA